LKLTAVANGITNSKLEYSGKPRSLRDFKQADVDVIVPAATFFQCVDPEESDGDSKSAACTSWSFRTPGDIVYHMDGIGTKPRLRHLQATADSNRIQEKERKKK
jgi:hypothetical protein